MFDSDRLKLNRNFINKEVRGDIQDEVSRMKLISRSIIYIGYGNHDTLTRID
jgi:hypothetical protein